MLLFSKELKIEMNRFEIFQNIHMAVNLFIAVGVTESVEFDGVAK